MPRRKIRSPGMGLSIGQRYSSIETSQEDFSQETEGKILIEKDHPFVTFCKQMGKKFPSFRRGAKFSDEHKSAVSFLGWKLTPGDFMAAMKGSFVTYIIPVIFIIAMVYVLGIGIEIGDLDTGTFINSPLLTAAGYDRDMAFTFFLFIAVILIGIVGMGIYTIYTYPLTVAKDEQNKALTFVPEIIGYMIMSMKLVPNLEKSIEFSAKHGRGRISTEFKRLIWDFQIGVHESVATGLDDLAYRWGEYSSELKEALMKIRASVMEPTEARRYELLDKTMLEVLESVKGKMEDYARSLNQPAVMLFYLGVLLPLILIIILPVGSAFSGSPLATTPILFFVYCVVIPVIAFQFAKNVIKNRPPTYEPPQINDNFSELPKKWSMDGKFDVRIIAGIILIVGIAGSFFLSTQGFPPKFLLGENFSAQIIPADKLMGDLLEEDGLSRTELGKGMIDLYAFELFFDVEKGELYNRLKDEISPSAAKDTALREYLIFINNPKTDPTKYLFWSGIMITLTIIASMLLFYRNTYKRQAQLKIMKMEDEFKESMYVIASRMGENKPVENALKHARDFLPNLLISKRIFGKTIENIELMGLPLDGAVFDPIYGSMKGIPSATLKTAMQLLVDSVTLGVEVASRTLMSLSLQLENMDKVNKGLKDMVSEISNTMMTMAIFIGPIVLGITVSLQKVVMMTLAGIIADPAVLEAQSNDIGAIAGGEVQINNLFEMTVEQFSQFATPLVFLIIIAIYVVEIVIIMIYFTTKIQEDNDLLFKMNLARYLPIAVTIFVITAYGANLLISGML